MYYDQSQDVFENPSTWKFVKDIFLFFIISKQKKTKKNKKKLRYKKKIITKTKFVDLLIYNSLLAGGILILPTVFELQGFEKFQKTPLSPNIGEMLPQLCCPG